MACTSGEPARREDIPPGRGLQTTAGPLLVDWDAKSATWSDPDDLSLAPRPRRHRHRRLPQRGPRRAAAGALGAGRRPAQPRRGSAPPRRSAGCATPPSTGRSSCRSTARPPPSVEREAATRAPGTWAVVLDADETVLDNSLYQLERARGREALRRRELDGLVRPARGGPAPRGLRVSLPGPRARREDRDRHQPLRRRVPGHGGGLPGARARLRRHALQAGRGPERQEPALRGGRARHDARGAATARDRRLPRRQHPGLPGDRARRSARSRTRPSRTSARASSSSRTRCTAAGRRTSGRGPAASP